MNRTISFALASFLSLGALAYGCAQSDTTPVVDDGGVDEDTGIAQFVDTGLPTDSGKKDGGVKNDGGTTVVDAGPPDTGAEGTTCNPATNPSEEIACGKCGKKSRACLPGANDAGYVWAPFGFCQGEKSGPTACDPSQTYPDAVCGNCGKTQKICQDDCTFIDGLSCNEAVNACHPGDTQFKAGLSCTNAGEGRIQTCDNTCVWSNPGACQLPPPNPNKMTVGNTVGAIATAVFPLVQAASGINPLVSGTCPTTLETSVKTNYVYVELKNPTAQTATVSVWSGKGPNALNTTSYYSAMAVYPGAYAPQASDTPARVACTGKVSTSCSSGIAAAACVTTSPCYTPPTTVGGTASCSNFSMAGLTVSSSSFYNNPVTVPPNSSVTIYFGAGKFTAGSTFYVMNDIVLNVKTETLL